MTSEIGKCSECGRDVPDDIDICVSCARARANNPLTAIHYYHSSRTRHKCINCGKIFNLTRHDKCPHCGKSYPYYTREEWEQAQK